MLLSRFRGVGCSSTVSSARYLPALCSARTLFLTSWRHRRSAIVCLVLRCCARYFYLHAHAASSSGPCCLPKKKTSPRSNLKEAGCKQGSATAPAPRATARRTPRTLRYATPIYPMFIFIFAFAYIYIAIAIAIANNTIAILLQFLYHWYHAPCTHITYSVY